MTQAEQVRSDTLTLLLTYRIHHLGINSVKQSANKIANTARIIAARTTDDVMRKACKDILFAYQQRRYYPIIILMQRAEEAYHATYHS